MSKPIEVEINGKKVQVQQGTSLAAALLQNGITCRISEQGERRTALCGMGICFECRVTVDGIKHRRSCQIDCVHGMQVTTDD